MDDLVSKISVQVESHFEMKSQESDKELTEYSESIIRTYSNTCLTQANQLQKKERREYVVLRYILKDQMDKIFEQREKKIRDYVILAMQAEDENRISDALRYFYWSYALLLSHPYHDEVEIETVKKGNILGEVYLYDRINRLFTRLEIIPQTINYNAEKEIKTIPLEIQYNGMPVENLDFSYFTGHGPSQTTQANNGYGMLELFGEASRVLSRLDLIVEYRYMNKCQDKEIKDVLETMSLPSFKKSNYLIEVSVNEDVKKSRNNRGQEFASKKIVYDKMNIKHSEMSDYRKIVNQILDAIQDKNYSKVREFFSEDGWNMYQKLIRYGNVTIIPMLDSLKVFRLDHDILVRAVPMSFQFANNNRTFVENVVFTFNHISKKIIAISFALSDLSIEDILSRSERFGPSESRYQLIQFIEYYKTAYALKRLDYIESIFNDNALIIVGAVLKQSKSIDGMYNTLSDNNVRYIRLNKQEYIKRLGRAFHSKEFINIRFEDNVVKKVNGDDRIYGIQIAQFYESSNYSDFGYLFLMVDLNDTSNPQVYVRTWQPQKNADGSIFGLTDFDLY